MVDVNPVTIGSVNLSVPSSGTVRVSNVTRTADVNTNGEAQLAYSWAVGVGLIQGIDYSAKYWAQQAKLSSDAAEEAIENIDFVAESAVSEINQTKESAVNTINELSTDSISSIQSATEDALDDINETGGQYVDQAQGYANQASSSALSASTDANHAHIWAEGNPGEVMILGGTNSAKGWAEWIASNAPTLTLEQTSTGAIYTATDLNGTTSVTILNGARGPKGDDGDTGNGIDRIDLTGYSSDMLTKYYRMWFTNLEYFDYSITDGRNGTNGTNGTNGSDGYSPTATVSKSGDTATITITDKNGTTTTTIKDGTNGTNGTNGQSASITGATASVTNTVGTPSVTVTSGGTALARSFNFAFTNLKGDKGDKGEPGEVTLAQLQSALSTKQDTLTAGTGIDITNNVISNTQTSANWGNITGTLSNQTDLQNALNDKQDVLTAGTDLEIVQGSILPNSYTQLTSITSTGTQWINSGIKLTNSFKSIIVGRLTGTPSTNFRTILGANNNNLSTGKQNVLLGWGNSANGFYAEPCTMPSYTYSSYQWDTNTHTFTTSVTPTVTTLNIDGVVDTINSAPSITGVNLAIFARLAQNDTVGSQVNFELNSIELYQSGSLVFKGVPAKRNSDDEVGLYDTVSGSFFLNSGTGDFVAGSEVPAITVINFTNDTGYITDINSSDVTTALGYTPVNPSSLATVATTGSYNDLADKPYIPSGVVVDQTFDPTSQNAQSGVAIAGAGFLTSISSSDVTTALGYTPYNSSNPNGYITSSALNGYATQAWVGQQGYLTSSSIANMQTTGNLVTSISSSSTDSQYPSAKCMYDIIGDIETLLQAV